MNTLPLISVITVCYQAAEPLEKTILSVRQQYYQPLEFIVVDGGSTDGTRDIISRHQDIITRWVSEPDRGIYDAMNKGVSMATGEWVIFMNAGDTFAANDVLLRIYKKTPTPKTPTPSPSRGEGSLITLTTDNATSNANQAPLPSGDWGLQSSHRCGCGPTKGSESPIRDGGQVGGGFPGGASWREFCSPVVPLARFPKFVYENTDTLVVPVELYNASGEELTDASCSYSVYDAKGSKLPCGFGVWKIAKQGSVGKNIALGTIRIPLADLPTPAKFTLAVKIVASNDLPSLGRGRGVGLFFF